MTYWDGSQWLPDEPSQAQSSARPSRITGLIRAGLLALLIAAAFVAPALGGKGGNPGNGNNGAAAVAACSFDGSTVSAASLPTGEVLNFMVTDARGTWGWVLGFSDTGSWAEPVPPPNGPTTYEFASRTWGPNGSKYNVFARCTSD